MNEETIELLQIDNKSYIILAKIDIYTYLVNEDDFKDMIIMKDDNNDLINLDNEEEVNKALGLFYNKYRNI
jgi:hypothetical protein